MKKIKNILVMAVVALLFLSCNSGLDELPLHKTSDITNLKFETRTIESKMVDIWLNGKTYQVPNEVVVFNSASATIAINGDAKTITVDFANDVNATEVVGISSISPGATVTPVGSAPKFGTVGDFSVERQYKVTSADKKNTVIWTIQPI